MLSKSKLCPLCRRIDNGAPKCRNHPEAPQGQRAFAKLGAADA